MSISSIDTFTVAPRSSEASGIAGREQQQLQHIAEAGETNFQKNVEQQSQRAVETKKSETEEYSFEGSGNNSYQRRKKKKQKSKSQEAPMAPKSNSSFDITI